MSETVLESGKMIPVKMTDDEALAEVKRLGHEDMLDCYKNPRETLGYEAYKDYIMVEGLGLCKLENFERRDANDYVSVRPDENGGYDFVAVYYNGGAGLSEVLEDGVREMDERPRT
jgi:hypothetical protein